MEPSEGQNSASSNGFNFNEKTAIQLHSEERLHNFLTYQQNTIKQESSFQDGLYSRYPYPYPMPMRTFTEISR